MGGVDDDIFILDILVYVYVIIGCVVVLLVLL